MIDGGVLDEIDEWRTLAPRGVVLAGDGAAVVPEDEEPEWDDRPNFINLGRIPALERGVIGRAVLLLVERSICGAIDVGDVGDVGNAGVVDGLTGGATADA